MAEKPEDKTEETPEIETPATDEAAATESAESSADETTAADEAPAAEEAPAAPAKPTAATRREKLEQRRTERRAKEAEGRGPRSPEERDAARREARKAKAAQRTRYRARLKTKRAEHRAAQPAQEPDHAPEHGPGRAKERTGLVVSDKADKTIIVRIDYQRRHKRYRKILRSSVTLHAHDERNDAHAGDTVKVVECRPMSRTKRWRLVDVLERAK
jgi:small subunit ribosomal protein S17